jgi:Domain of unknown function (DUF4166)
MLNEDLTGNGSPPSLYRRILGPRFEALPGVLRRFHDSATGGRARGTFQVERGRGFLRNAIASLLGFPRAGVDVPVILEVSVEGDRERWRRRFPGETVVSVQWERDQLLFERFGMNSFSCNLMIKGDELLYEFRRAWLAGIPLPSWASPRIEGVVKCEEDGWRVVTGVFAPVLGKILHYEGLVRLE